MTLVTALLNSGADAFADKAIDWIFAVGIVVVIAVCIIRWVVDTIL